MEYIVDIIDTKNANHTISIERALRSSLILDWQGGDKKDGQNIIGSSFALTLIAMTNQDGAYSDLYTGDETNYKVRLYQEDETTIWTGFLLPDLYSEPYESAPVVIKFKATDGLGRIKGKYLPADFYEPERSVIEIIAACLKLTGLNLNFRFSPAIENAIQKDYNQIYLDTAEYIDNNKKQDAYKILNDLLESMGCVVFQADDYFNVVGLNIMQRRVYDAKVYDVDGIFQEEITITRLLKDVTGLATPNVTIQPPYGVISIEHERNPLGFAETISKEENEGWLAYGPTFSNVYATDWTGRNGFYAYGLGKEEDRQVDNVYFSRRVNPNNDSYINVRKQPYLQRGKKYKMVLNFEIEPFLFLGTAKDFIDAGIWTNPFDFDVKITFDSQYYNLTESESLFNNINPSDGTRYIEQNFNEEFRSENTFYFIPSKSGLLDVQIFPLNAESLLSDAILVMKIMNLTIEDLGFEEQETAVIENTEDFTLKKELSILYADDATGESVGFRLHKLKGLGDFNAIDIPILNSLFFEGKYHYIVSLAGANLIKDNIDTVYTFGAFDTPITGLEVEYNWKSGQEHVVISENQITQEAFTVRVYDYNSVTENRSYWEQWTDSLYKIEKLRYIKAKANIYSKLFDKSLISLTDFTVRDNVKINDFIKFNYKGNKPFMLPNCQWDIDRGHSRIQAIEAYYAVEEGANIPPIVETGNDIFMEENSTLTTLYSDAYDPDGFIVSGIWEEVTNNGASIVNPAGENTSVTGLTGDYYEFRRTVTDNDGATGSDTVRVYRIQQSGLSLNNILDVDTGSMTTPDNYKEKHFTFNITPEISEGEVVNITGRLTVSKQATNATIKSSMIRAKIKRGGVYITELEIRGPGNRNQISEFSVSYIAGSELIVELYAEWIEITDTTSPWEVKFFSKIEVENAQYIEGLGNISGTPIMEEVTTTITG